MALLRRIKSPLVLRRHRESMASKAKNGLQGLRDVMSGTQLGCALQCNRISVAVSGELTQLAKVLVEQNIRHSAWNGYAALPIVRRALGNEDGMRLVCS
jgi:hypothetical protein